MKSKILEQKRIHEKYLLTNDMTDVMFGRKDGKCNITKSKLFRWGKGKRIFDMVVPQ